MKRAFLLIALLLGVALAACTAAGDFPDDDSRAPPDQPVPGDDGGADAVLVIEQGVADGPGISVADALGWEGDPTPVLVNGALFIDEEGDALLCDAMAESFPPQCAGARLEVRGLDLSGIPEVQEANGVRWADSIQLFGRVEPAG